MGLVIQAAIVDLDGTMVDTLGDFEIALNCTMADLDLPPITRALVERTVGKGSEHLIRSVLAHQLAQPEANVSPCVTTDTLYEPAWLRYQHHYLRCNGQHSDVYPGVVEGLQALQGMHAAVTAVQAEILAPLPLAAQAQFMQLLTQLVAGHEQGEG